jgi:hypothetical protein
MDDRQAQQMRANLISKQLEIDKLKNTIRRMEDDNNARQRSDTSREKTKRTSKGSDSNK